MAFRRTPRKFERTSQTLSRRCFARIRAVLRGGHPFAEVLVPEEGVEPTRPCGQRILSPPRLPFRHSGDVEQLYPSE